jgi:hypothetical protein
MVVVVPQPGPQGPQGPAGPQGPEGPAGTGGDLTYQHTQLVPAAVWTIDHNLGKEPAVTVISSADDEVIGDVSYPTPNRVVLTFSSAFAGRARLN